MKWYILLTRPKHDRLVTETVRRKGFEALCIYHQVVKIHRKRYTRLQQVPLFPRYVFVRCYLDEFTHIALFTVRGVVCLLEDAEGQLIEVSEEDMRFLNMVQDLAVFSRNVKVELIPRSKISDHGEGSILVLNSLPWIIRITEIPSLIV